MKHFKKIEPTKCKKIIAAISGPEKSGKTHFCFTGPSNVAYIKMDIGGEEGVINSFPNKPIYCLDIEFDPTSYIADKTGSVTDKNRQKLDQIYKKFVDAYIEALTDKTVRTLVIDSATELWELMRLSVLGKLTKVMPIHYQTVNSHMKNLMRQAYYNNPNNTNVLWIFKNKKEYHNENWTGKYEISGFNESPYIVQANLVTSYNAKKKTFGIAIENNRLDPEFNGERLEGNQCNFPTLASLLTDTDEDIWK